MTQPNEICLKGTSNYYYHHRDRLGKGTYSIVYRGRSEDGKLVAIKEMILDEKNNVDRDWRREIEMMKKINHVNLVRFYDYIEDNNTVYLIMEYCEGGTFSYLEKPMEEKKLREYLKQIVSGLGYLHKQNIYHRDLKPDNILLTWDNQIKICDFTFTRELEANDYCKATMCGSPYYMAPELFMVGGADVKSDIWSLGIILYTYIYGVLPYPTHGGLNAIIETLKRGEMKFPDCNNQGQLISLECLSLVKSMLNHNIRARISWIISWFILGYRPNANSQCLDPNHNPFPSPSIVIPRYRLIRLWLLWNKVKS